MKKEMKIQDLFPTNASFRLTLNKKSWFGKNRKSIKYNLVPCTPSKLIEINNIFGDANEMIATPSLENISKVAMSLMALEDAKRFARTRVKRVNPETGIEENIIMGGYQLLMSLVYGMSDFLNMYQAVLYSLGYNRSFIDEIISDIRNGVEKETDKEVEKKIVQAQGL